MNILDQREKEYGPFQLVWDRIAVMYKEYKQSDNVTLDSAADFAMMMTFLKISRESFKPSPDNIVDAIGYLQLYQRNLVDE